MRDLAAPMTIPVLAAPLFDPGQGRRKLEVPHGLTLEEIVALALPELRPEDRGALRVMLLSGRGAAAPPARDWARIRPNPGVRVVIRLVPGKGDILRSVLLIAVSVAAIAAAPALTPAAWGVVGTTLATAGLTIAGSLLVNALIPPPKPSRPDGERRNTFAVSGWRNELRPGERVPLALGRHRYAPPFAAPSYTEIVGDQQYIRGLFCFGYGRLDISDLRLGDTPLSEYDEVETEIREGTEADEPVTLYPRQVLEEAVNAELVRPLPRDDAGDVIEGEAGALTPIVRWTAGDASEATVILAFQAGLFGVSDGGDLRSATVQVRIRQRPESGGDWSEVATLDITARKREAFFRQHRWTFPARGRWRIEVARLTDETVSLQVTDRVTLAGIQSIRPEYPIAMEKPLALVAMRIKATYQLNGAIENFNAVVQRHAPTWDGAAWADGPSRNPASACLAALQGPGNPFPAADAEIDLEQLADWHAWCAAKDLKYDRVHDQAESLQEMLVSICAAGRASPRHDGVKWGVVIDRPETFAVDHISPRNAQDFRWSRPYFDPPDAIRVPFLDETDGWASAEMTVLWPGFSGDPETTEVWELPGKTDPREIWIETRRRQYELLFRPDEISCVQDGAARTATRGDLVMASIDILDRSQGAFRVKSVEERLVEIDGEVEIVAGEPCAIRFRVFADEEDTVGSSVVAGVTPIGQPGAKTRLLRVQDPAAQLPVEGTLAHVGLPGTETFALRLREVEAGKDLSSVLRLLAAAPIIDELVDAEVPPAWNGRVGAEVEMEPVAPSAPRFSEILTGRLGTGAPNGMRVILQPGSASSVTVWSYVLEHRPTAASEWMEILLPAAAGGTGVAGYALGDAVTLRARAVSVDGVESPWTNEVEVVVGANDPPIPEALDADAITVVGDLGCIRATVATTSDAATAQIQLYRAPAGAPLDPDLHAAGEPFRVSPGTTVSYVDGDGTRVNLLSQPAFDAAGVWVADAGWTITGGTAQHAAGDADTIRQSLPLSEGAIHRIGYRVSGRTAGDVAATIFGGASAAISADGLVLETITAPAAAEAFGFSAGSDFDGAVDDAVLYRQSARCIPAGQFDVYLEPQDLAGVPGAVAGPFSVTVY